MKKTLSTLSACLLMAGASQAATTVSSPLTFGTGSLAQGTVITTSQTFGGATFDILYTLGATGGTTPATATINGGASYGISSNTDVAANGGTLDGDDSEGISFTSLSFDNFVANGSGLTIADLSNLRFTQFGVNSAGNLQDRGYISFTGFTTNLAATSPTLNTVPTTGTTTFDLDGLIANPGTPTALYLTSRNGAAGNNSANRWSVGSLQATFDVADPIPEPSSSALLGLGLAGLLMRRRRA